MSVTQTDLRYTYEDDLGDKTSKTFANVADTVTNAQAQAFGTVLEDNDVYPGGISTVTKIEKISTTTTEVPLS